MNKRSLLEISSQHLGIICLCIITTILLAGLWPRTFHTGNDVALSSDGKGLQFSGRGSIYTKERLVHRGTSSSSGAFSIETAIQADKDSTRNIAVIVSLNDGLACERLIIGQWKSHLIIRSRKGDTCNKQQVEEIGIANALIKGEQQVISITSGSTGTDVYVNGILQKSYAKIFFLQPHELLSGRLVLGNSAQGRQAWVGTLSGLAIYDTTLTAGEVRRHAASWRTTGFFSKEKNPALTGHYYFREQAGPIIHDHSGLGNDIMVPDRFTPLHRSMLTMPWQDFHADKAYARDVAINILGFIPFGFYVAWYLSERGSAPARVLIMVMLLGVGTSLSIELLQAYLPERTSQLIDVLMNSSGTALGIFFWKRFIHPFLRV